MKKQSPVQQVIGIIYHESMKANGPSWTRLNGVLRSAMADLITAGVKFEANDVEHAISDFNGGFWSSIEAWYSSACGLNHSDGGGNLTAAISIENYTGRKPFIWAERTKTPSRLCVGSQFTWNGERVTVTSFNDQQHTLTACSFTQDLDYETTIYALDGERRIEARVDYPDGSVAVRLSAPFQRERKIKRRFTISHEELAKVRADYDARRRKHEKAIKSATTLDELGAVRRAAQDEGAAAYRHFDLEILSAAIQARRDAITSGMPLEEVEQHNRADREASISAWISGADTRPYFSGIIRLRVKDGFVECSNGNKVSLEAARKTLAFVQRYREKGWEQNRQVYDVDAFRLTKISEKGVQIGCTLIDWEEVDRFTPILKATANQRKAKVPA